VRERGFTLVELVISIALMAVVGGFGVLILRGPLQSQQAQSLRAAVSGSVGSVQQNLRTVLADALPGSVRVVSNGSVVAVELLQVEARLRLRSAAPPADPAGLLDLLAVDSSFDIVRASPGLALPLDTTSRYLAIGHTGLPGQSAWQLVNVISAPGTRIQLSPTATVGEWRATLTPGVRYARMPTSAEAYLITGPQTLLCDRRAGTLSLYSGYSIAANQANRDSAAELLAAGATATLLATQLTACTARLATAPSPASPTIVQMNLTMTRGGESMTGTAAAAIEAAT
jgi:prepilin-type N-terminal cleavage/methylation domain-containing protein